MTTHALGQDRIHTAWDRNQPPALHVSPGDTVTVRTLDASYGRVARQVQAGQGGGPAQGLTPELAALITAGAYSEPPSTGLRGHPLTGPVFVEGAEAGDVLVTEVLDIRVADWGWTACRPDGIGLLDAELGQSGALSGPVIRYWDLQARDHTSSMPGVRLPLAPFCGVMGVAPAAAGPHPTSPPRQVGGNMDIRQLVAGSTLYLPVEVPGALFSVGDVHAAQGDGELSGTGIETEAEVTLRFGLAQGRPIGSPQLRTPPAPETQRAAGGWYATSGHAPDLMEAARIAVREMLAHLQREYGLSAADAYILSSVAVDLKISQIVDAPHWTVCAFLPLGIFVS